MKWGFVEYLFFSYCSCKTGNEVITWDWGWVRGIRGFRREENIWNYKTRVVNALEKCGKSSLKSMVVEVGKDKDLLPIFPYSRPPGVKCSDGLHNSPAMVAAALCWPKPILSFWGSCTPCSWVWLNPLQWNMNRCEGYHTRAKAVRLWENHLQTTHVFPSTGCNLSMRQPSINRAVWTSP